MDRAELIIRCLSGEHLHWFLPGGDNKAAISHCAGSLLGGISRDGSWGVSRQGIGEWPGCIIHHERRKASATLFLTWPEVLAVIAAGCAGGYRERYEAAYAEWSAGVDAAWKDYKPGGPSPQWVDQSAITETKQALIRHGCELTEDSQITLF